MYYVYELIDPRDGAVFYVGKGKGRRLDQHEIDAAKGRQSRKCDRIRAIVADGLSVTKRKVRLFADEQEAFDFEAETIERHGLTNLTNLIPGGGSPRNEPTVYADRVQVRATAELTNRTSDGRVSSLLVNGEKLDLAPILAAYKAAVAAIVERRGVEWANCIATRFNVRFAVNG